MIIVIIIMAVTILVVHIPQRRMFQNAHPKMIGFHLVETIVFKFIFECSRDNKVSFFIIILFSAEAALTKCHP